MPLRDFVVLMIVCTLWALSNVVSKFVVSVLEVPPLFYAAARFAVVLAALFPFLRSRQRLSGRLLLAAFLMGAGNFGLLFVGLKYSTPSAAGVVMQLNMPFTLLLSMAFLGERVRPVRQLGIFLAFAGVLMVMWDPHGFALSGGLVMVAGAAAMASVGVILTKQIEGVRPIVFQAWVGATSVLPLALLSVILEPGQLQLALDAGWRFWAAVIFSAGVVSVGAHTVYILLLQRYEAGVISALILVTPLATIGLSVALLGDHFSPRLIVGSALALTGVLIIALRGNPAARLLLAIQRRT